MSSNLSKKAKKLKNQATTKKSSKKNNLFIILLSSIIIVLITIFVVVILPSGESGQKPTGTLSPAAKGFTLQDTEGNMHNLSDYAGKPILLDFTASWCSWCHVQAPELIRLHKDYGDEFTMISINSGEDTKTAAMNKENEGTPWTYLVDQNSTVMRDYGVQGIPYLILLKPDGSKYIDQSGYKKDFYNSFSSALKELR